MKGKDQVPMCPMYKSDPIQDLQFRSPDLRKICKVSNSLTFDHNSKTGFKEIGVVEPCELMEPIDVKENPALTAHQTSLRLVFAIANYFKKTWDSNKRHVIMHSGGKDSRLISMTLKLLEVEHGKDWLGEVLFVHHLEGKTDKLFKSVMKQSGWRDDQWHICGEDDPDKEDYFDYGNFKANANSFWPTTFRWWHEVIPLDEEKDWVDVWGSEGNSIGKLGKHTIDKFLGFHPYYSELFLAFNGFLCPYTSYDFVELNLQIPLKFKNHSAFPNKMRTLALKKLGDRLPYHVHHSYNFKLSTARKHHMKENYLASKFYHDFQSNNLVRNAKPWDKRMYSDDLDSKIYGLATMYEGI